MTHNEIKKARALLADHVDRTEVIGDGAGGQYLTAYWREGGQKLFYSLDAVEQHAQTVQTAHRAGR